MAKHSANVIMDYVNPKTFVKEDVLEATGIYAVYYDNKPFNLRTSNLPYTKVPKYRRVTFMSHPGHAHTLAKKLNAIFKTDKFQVFLLNDGTPLPPTDA